MEVVLGLSMTSRAVRWVLVEGTTGEGATVDRGAFALDVPMSADDLLDVLLVSEVDAERLHAIGVTWTTEAADTASGVLRSLTARGFDNVIAVSEIEAADVLAAGIAAIADYDDVAVCVVEPDAALVAVVDSDGVTVDRIARPLDGGDVVELPSSVLTMLERDDWHPDAFFVVGSADDLDLITSTLDGVTDAPVLSAAEADVALARGAALAAAHAVNTLQPTGPRLPTKIGALSAVLAAAVVTFVVSLSVALGLQLASDAPPQPQAANAVDQPVASPAAPPPPRRVSIEEARPVVAQTIVVAAPPAPVAAPEPVYDPPAYSPPAPAYSPPSPAYVPPPAPAYVPPQVPNYVPPVPQPRLRDRIIERIPIINRFHEPEYPYPR